ncbi:MAG: class II aldolase/adducin family protein, partial [Defluviitaleaceae bacterium]|nr:class II aldolase/adducin family protein [Defluviitaleaceae bacterium]
MVESLAPIDQAIWVAKSLFDRGKTSGSTANISFRHENGIYITSSGTCFGFLTSASFSLLDEAGTCIGGAAPSKEYPLHMAIYKQRPHVRAVIHTHSFYSV